MACMLANTFTAKEKYYKELKKSLRGVRRQTKWEKLQCVLLFFYKLLVGENCGESSTRGRCDAQTIASIPPRHTVPVRPCNEEPEAW